MVEARDVSSIPLTVRVSIVIPCRNEEQFIGPCLESILNGSYPSSQLEVFVIDGESEDRTAQIVRGYAEKYQFIHILSNPRRYMAAGTNIGIRNTSGELIMIMGAHAKYGRTYIEDCVRHSVAYAADNVGGHMRTLPAEQSVAAKGICYVISHRFGTGVAKFRSGGSAKCWVDTVFGGCYKREVFKRIGLFNEALTRGQDREFNSRLVKNGGKILFVPEIESYYYAWSSVRQLARKMLSNGHWVFYGSKLTGRQFASLRNWIPVMFVSTIAVLLAASTASNTARMGLAIFAAIYGVFTLVAAMPIAMKELEVRYLFFVPFLFLLCHTAYGLGSIYGMMKGIFRHKPLQEYASSSPD